MAPNPTTRDATKLIQLKEKMSALRQEEEKICQTLAQDLAQCLINTQALEVDFDTLIGGILEVVNQAQINSTKTEVWKKSGQKFRRNRGQNERNKGGEKQGRQERQQGSSQSKQLVHPHSLSAIPKSEKVTEKIT